MGGGLMQLVAYGAQDVYLTGNPQITFFKVVYRRHTNFAMECIEQTMTGNPDFGRRTTVTITRNGDLVTKMYLRVVLNEVTSKDGLGQFAWVRRLGHALINYVEVEIGGSRIDKHYGTWLDLWYELSHTTEQERGYDQLIGDVPKLINLTSPSGSNNLVTHEYIMFIPLQFWFNRNNGLALPLIALQYHEVRLNFEFNDANVLYVATTDFNPNPISMQDCSLLVDYIYLDSEERRRFAQVGHEYLIEQLQFTGGETANTRTTKSKLAFNHPCKELVFAIINGNYLPNSSNAQAFLGYSSTDDWTSALQAAANNLAAGMVSIQVDAGSIPGYVFVFDPHASSSNSFIGNVALSDGHNILVDIDVQDNTVFNTGAPGFNNYAIYLKDTPFFTFSGLDLADNLLAMSIIITGTVAGPVSNFEVQVSVTSHNLTIDLLSVPVSMWVDNRVNTGSISAGLNPNDVLVFQYSNYGVFIDGSLNPIAQGLLQLNGHDRFDQREGSYFNYVQPYQHHTHTPADGINVYSFALHPEQHQPSGTANLSRIDTTQLNLIYIDTKPYLGYDVGFLNNDTTLYVFATNYNVLRIMSGMGGLAYSN